MPGTILATKARGTGLFEVSLIHQPSPAGSQSAQVPPLLRGGQRRSGVAQEGLGWAWWLWEWLDEEVLRGADGTAVAGL